MRFLGVISRRRTPHYSVPRYHPRPAEFVAKMGFLLGLCRMLLPSADARRIGC